MPATTDGCRCNGGGQLCAANVNHLVCTQLQHATLLPCSAPSPGPSRPLNEFVFDIASARALRGSCMGWQLHKTSRLPASFCSTAGAIAARNARSDCITRLIPKGSWAHRLVPQRSSNGPSSRRLSLQSSPWERTWTALAGLASGGTATTGRTACAPQATRVG